MAEVLEEAEFWLPLDFLADEDIFMEDNKINLKKNGQRRSTEFPYQEEQLAELTRHFTLQQRYPKSVPSPPTFENSRVISRSPQSTLLHVNNSWSGRSPGSSKGGSPNSASPPTTPFGAKSDSWDLIFYQAAAGQVREEQMGGVWFNNGLRNRRNHEQQHHQMGQNQSKPQVGSGMLAVSSGENGNGGRGKRQCAGTGVFLPRGYGSNKQSSPTISSKKKGCSTAGVVQLQSHHQSQPPFYTAHNETVVARRNALLMQQSQNLRPQVGMSYETRLPQEWTY